MRLAYFFLAFVCFMLTLTHAKPSLQERLPQIKSTTTQNYALLKPLSATISYIYYATQLLSSTHNDQHTTNTNIKFDTSNDSTIIFFKEQNDLDEDITKSIIINNASSNTIDVNHHNGPITALALVLFFCVLTF
ncbi:hypothetical protein BCR42DRAFT_486544 [Absidia repens]|uniref:Uncharacterized protein n=1 Tax=Absidia repens TaxID=90262 RepID=A0A1X2IY99_9FUNG|nr:hypothetical protein BCR42DRAFT_486544 [Absidia repens]